MKPKTLITLLLLVFVGVCVFVAATKKTTPPNTSTKPTQRPNSITVYYFHGNIRCATCNKLESYTTLAINESFADAQKQGKLTFKVINKDLPENKHYVNDYITSEVQASLGEI